MKATKIYYQKCFNLGNYQNEVVGIELEIEEGEKALEALEKAKTFVESRDFAKAVIEEYDKYYQIANDPDNYTGREVKHANEYLSKYAKAEELPF
ncbi:hypothetical protein OCV73_00085 [Barnesiella propionica]|uniref:hypothetical protein n=1 Tax=Barnesiella propionica TaxID=2981781 RepID=UPI0011C9C93E|nr:hypothetical protein [Barnesiella propionica]MCU6767360.1 hypothetical protein [Barnesiella propionica]